ncbi:MAG: hypothetical protein EXS08_01625 [Planctomycetes bacterium]|nr:hypothetical protein [Planctomycetota bacterium]
MSRARLRSLLGLLALLALVLVARLFQVQVKEHTLWAREAARLVTKGKEKPYHRGRILDAQGIVLAQDEERRSVALNYRRFRREHPLGEVAHARSLLEGRPIPLSEARAQLVPWARELLALGPRELRAFARDPRAGDGRVQSRRAADLLFYLQMLLHLERHEEREHWKALLELAREENETRSFLELAAAVRRGATPADVQAEWSEVEAQLARSLERLEVLARWIQPPAGEHVEGVVRAAPLDWLVDELERVRVSVEDATAAKLFAEATGFAPGRLAPDTLLECFDHGWILALLGWDRPRLERWAATVSAGWKQKWRDELCLPQLFADLLQDRARKPAPSDFLDRLAVVYEPEGALDLALDEGPRPWRELDRLAVFDGLDELFAADVSAAAVALGRTALPLQLDELRADPDPERLLPEGAGPDSFRARLARCFEARSSGEVATLGELAALQLELWDLRFQETLRAALDETRRAATREELGSEGGLLLAVDARERAAERAEYFLKDFGSRLEPLAEDELSYDVVYLLTRYESDFPGFQVRESEARARVELAKSDDKLPAERLLGRVSAPTLDDRLRQRRERSELRRLKEHHGRGEDEEEELLRLVGALRLPSQVRGVEGLEAFLDPELTGKNGYEETRGADVVYGAESNLVAAKDPVDGRDVRLTLYSGIQADAQRCLRSPSREHEDPAWASAPVGAIVVLAMDGSVLAAASEPDDESQLEPGAQPERYVLAERTLTKRTFQPPGSVFKVFVALWALEHGLDPARTVTCAPIERGGAGYKDLRCHSTTGHGEVNLHAALVQSCNAYFAWLGETLSTEDFRALCAEFGFGQPTGVRDLPLDDGEARTGLREDLAGLSLPTDGSELAERLRRRVANGLTGIEVTPMQIARGFLELATGEKHELRLVQSVGAHELAPHPGAPLPFSARNLELVRAAMRGVAEEGRGTAHEALSRADLGFSVAVKTGSADLVGPKEGSTKVRKHAWVAGWAPAEDPKLVFVVFEHDTGATSSHGAVYLTRDLLRQPQVLIYLAEQGVDVSGVPAREH